MWAIWRILLQKLKAINKSNKTIHQFKVRRPFYCSF